MALKSVHVRAALILLAACAAVSAQIVEGSFEGGLPGGTTAPSPWVTTGTALVFPALGCTTDPALGMPAAGAQWMRIGSGGGAATPSSFTNAFNISQTFTTGASGTQLHLDVAFSTGEGAGSSFNDFLAVTVSNGTVTPTLLLLQTSTGSFPNTACGSNQAATAPTSVDVDLASVLPGLTPSTPVTLRIYCANGGDNAVQSFSYVDNVYVGAPPPPPVDVSFTQDLGGNWTYSVVAAGHPGAEAYNLFSLIIVTPTGTGPVFGIGFNADVLAQMLAPVGSQPFHVLLNGSGSYSVGPIPIPPGLSIDTVSVIVQSGVVLEYSPAIHVVF